MIDVDSDDAWEIRTDWGRRVAESLRQIDVEGAITMIADQIRRSGQQITNGELVVRIVHSLADRIELLPHALADEDPAETAGPGADFVIVAEAASDSLVMYCMEPGCSWYNAWKGCATPHAPSTSLADLDEKADIHAASHA